MICYFSNVGDLFMKRIMYDFINEVVNNNLTTKMLIEIFGYSPYYAAKAKVLLCLYWKKKVLI